MDRLERKKLVEIIQQEEGNYWWNESAFVEKILPFLPKCLKIISLPPKKELNYNCFVYILGLGNNPQFLGGNKPIQEEFIKYLITNGFLKETSNLEKGNLIFYFDGDGTITHGAILLDNKEVISKWMWGPVIKIK